MKSLTLSLVLTLPNFEKELGILFQLHKPR